jgi:hypothetical protein
MVVEGGVPSFYAGIIVALRLAITAIIPIVTGLLFLPLTILVAVFVTALRRIVQPSSLSGLTFPDLQARPVASGLPLTNK